MPRPESDNKKLEWKDLIEQQRTSRLSVQKWCQQNQVNPHTFRYWKAKLFPKSLKKSHFIEFKMKRPDAVSLQARGLHIRIGSTCDLNVRKQLFALFTEVSC